MIEMTVGIDDIPDGLVGNILFGFGDDCIGARLALRAFNDDDVVLEVDCQCGVRRENE